MHKPLDSLNDTQSSSVTIQKCMIKPKTGCNDNNSDDKKNHHATQQQERRSDDDDDDNVCGLNEFDKKELLLCET